MITGINESKILIKHISCEWKCKFDVFQINGGITINVYVSVKNFMYVKKIICGVSLHVVVKMQIVSKYYG